MVKFCLIYLPLHFAVMNEIMCTTFIEENTTIGCYQNQRCVIIPISKFRPGKDAMWKCKFAKKQGIKVAGEFLIILIQTTLTDNYTSNYT